MKINTRKWTNYLAAWLMLLAVFFINRAKALDVIDPTGVNYTGVSDSSEYNGSYGSANLFDLDMTGVSLGTILSGNEYADAGLTNCFVAFQVEAIYTNVASVFYAQRSGSNPAEDKIGIIRLWSSPTTPFTAADPGTPPDSVIEITNSTGGQWTEYLMTNMVAGQYFLIELEQTIDGGNPGGMQFRLGAVLGLAPSVSVAPVAKTTYVGGTARFSASASGTAPLTYTWTFGGNVLQNGGQISGADTGNLVISDVTPANAGEYSLTIANNYGTTNMVANLTVEPAPTNAAEATVIDGNPLAFWQLNDPPGSTIALDLAGSYNGSYGSDSGLGVDGPQSPAYPGFSSTNTALQTYAYDIGSAVTLPPLDISATNSVTILAWIYQDGSQGPQQPYTGIVFGRGAGTAAGLICSADGTQLAYQWGGNRYNFASGLILPTNQWTMVALVYTTNFTTLYCGSTNGVVLSAVDNYAQVGQTFEGNTWIGLDPDVGESSRTFNGSIDDVAFFNRALSSSEIDAIYDAGTGIVPTLQIIGQTATNLNVFQGQPINLSVQVSGLNPVYQWYEQNTPIAGATNSFYTITNATVADSGNYYVVVTNTVNSVTSATITVTVPSYVVVPIGASGVIYTNVSWSSEYNADYSGTNMFDSDLTGVSLGAHLAGNDWADDGYGTAFVPAYLAFQVDKSYSVSAVLYAQRNDQSGQTIDKITALSIWGSTSTPFAAADPGTTPDAVVSIPDVDAGILHAYVLPATVTGQYFVIEVAQNPVVYGSNIGGNEFRLATLVTPAQLTFTNSPTGLILNWPSGATLQQSDNLYGPWVTATGVTSGIPISTTAPMRFYRLRY